MKSWRASLVTSRTVSLMSCRSTSVRVIRSIDNFNSLSFLRDPARFARCWHFNYVDVIFGSAPPSAVSASFSSYPCVVWPLPTFKAASCATAAAVAFSYSAAFYAASYAVHTSAVAASFLCFSANCAMCNLALSFFLCSVNFSIFAMFGAHHFGGHASSTLKMTSYVATKDSFIHCLIRSLHTLM